MQRVLGTVSAINALRCVINGDDGQEYSCDFVPGFFAVGDRVGVVPTSATDVTLASDDVTSEGRVLGTITSIKNVSTSGGFITTDDGVSHFWHLSGPHTFKKHDRVSFVPACIETMYVTIAPDDASPDDDVIDPKDDAEPQNSTDVTAVQGQGHVKNPSLS